MNPENGNATANVLTPEDMLTQSQVQALSDYLFTLFQVYDNGALRKMQSSNPKDPQKNDPRRTYFSKAKIDALFAANPGSDGLFIYFGAHNSSISPLPPENKAYENKLMAILVTATGMTPNLLDDDEAKINAGGAGCGMDRGKLCPPDICG